MNHADVVLWLRHDLSRWLISAVPATESDSWKVVTGWWFGECYSLRNCLQHQCAYL